MAVLFALMMNFHFSVTGHRCGHWPLIRPASAQLVHLHQGQESAGVAEHTLPSLRSVNNKTHLIRESADQSGTGRPVRTDFSSASQISSAATPSAAVTVCGERRWPTHSRKYATSAA